MPPIGMYLVAGALVLTSLALLAVELFLPSHGILGIIALLIAAGGVVVAYMAHPLAGLLLGIVVLLTAPFAVYWAIRLYPQTAVGKKVILGKPEAKGFAPQAEQLAQLSGKRGVAISMLRPAGMCEIEGRRIDCISESALIEAGTPVQVVSVIGMRVIVAPVA